MNNFINVRLKTYNHTKQYSIIKHNLRKIKSLSEIEKDQKFIEDGPLSNFIKSQHTNNGQNLLIMGNATLILDDNLKDLFYQTLSQQYQNDREEHNQRFKEIDKRNLRNNKSTWVEGVFTFSEQLKEDLGTKYSLEEIIEVAKDCLNDISKKLGGDVCYMVAHQDEKSFHFHWALKNYDKRGLSLFHKINNTKDFSEIQDIGFEHFGKLGMQRGIKKEFSNSNHQNQHTYWEKQLILSKNDLEGIKSEIKQQSKIIDAQELNIKYMNAFIDNFHNQATNILGYDTKNIDFNKVFKDLNNKVENDINKINSSLVEAKKLKENLILEIGQVKEEKKLILSDITKTKDQKHNELSELDNLLLTKRTTQSQISKLELELKGVRSEKKAHITQKQRVKENIEKYLRVGFLRDLDGLVDDLENNFSFINVMAQNEKNKTLIHHMGQELDYYKKLEEFGKLDKVISDNQRLKEQNESIHKEYNKQNEKIKSLEIDNRGLKVNNNQLQNNIEKQKNQFNRYKRRVRKTFSTKIDIDSGSVGGVGGNR